MSDSDIYAKENFESITEDPAHSFAMEMGIDPNFHTFCMYGSVRRRASDGRVTYNIF